LGQTDERFQPVFSMRLIRASNTAVFALSAVRNLASAFDLFNASVDAIRSSAEDILRLRQFTHALPTRWISGFGLGGGTGRLSLGMTIFGGPGLAPWWEPSLSMGVLLATEVQCPNRHVLGVLSP